MATFLALTLVAGIIIYLLIRRFDVRRMEQMGINQNPSASLPTGIPAPPSTFLGKFVRNMWDTWMERALYGSLIAYAVIIFLAWLNTKPDGINWFAIFTVVCLCHLFTSFKVVNEQEIGTMVLLGWILGQLNSGPWFAPWPIRIRKITKNSVQVDFGTIEQADRDRAQRSADSDSWFVMEEPIRINWGDIKSTPGVTEDDLRKYANDPYAQRLTTDPHLYFRFRVSNFPSLIEKVGDLEEAVERIKDTCVTAMSEMAGKTYVAKAILEIDIISAEIFKKVEALVNDPNSPTYKKEDSWGIDVEEVRIKDLGTPKRTNEAVADRARDIALADGKATATRLEAAANRDKFTEEAVGKANAVRSAADAEEHRLTRIGVGESSALKAVAEAASTEGGRLVLGAKALETVGKAGNTFVLPAEMGLLTEVLTGAAAVKKVTADKTAKTPQPTEPPVE